MDWKKYYGLLIIFIITAIFLVVLLIMGAGNLLAGDEQLFMALNPSFNPANPTFFDHFFVQYSTWGPLDWGIQTWGFIIFGIAFVLLSLRIEKLRPTRFILILVIIGVIVGFFGITTVLKHVILRARPFVDISSSSANSWVPIFYPGEDAYSLFDAGLESFPSGHATSAFIFATPLIIVSKKYWIKAFAIVYGVLGAYGRVFLGVHYPIDIFVGSLIGIFTIWIFYILLKRYLIPKAPWFEYE